MILIIILLNAIRFIGLDFSPPGFYADEAAGATQALCIAQDGYDYFGNRLPLFAPGFFGSGMYTPFFLYGEIVWTSLFGNSISAFRAFSGLVTSTTILFLFLLVRHQVNLRAASYVAFIASILPWSFQFSRIAWDPPLAPMFLIIGIWVIFTKRPIWLAGVMLAFAAYSYPPVRVSALLLILFMPLMDFRKKGWLFLCFLLASVPMAFQLSNPEFLVRTKLMAIWNHPELNPNPELGIFGYGGLFFEKFIAHFKGSFLFNEGDKNLRHGIIGFGLLTWLEKFSLIVCFGYLVFLKFKNAFLKNDRQILQDNEITLLKLAFLGIIFGVVPSALTIEGVPHALRSLAAWPFYALLSGILIYYFGQLTNSKIVLISVVLTGLIYFCVYLKSYFLDYPHIAKDAFQINTYGIDHAYKRMTKDALTCEQARGELRPPPSR